MSLSSHRVYWSDSSQNVVFSAISTVESTTRIVELAEFFNLPGDWRYERVHRIEALALYRALSTSVIWKWLASTVQESVRVPSVGLSSQHEFSRMKTAEDVNQSNNLLQTYANIRINQEIFDSAATNAPAIHLYDHVVNAAPIYKTSTEISTEDSNMKRQHADDLREEPKQLQDKLCRQILCWKTPRTGTFRAKRRKWKTKVLLDAFLRISNVRMS